MSVQLRTADANLTVAVSRAAPGDLVDGVQERLRRVEGVEEVSSLALEDVRPRLNDLTVTVSVTLELAPDLSDAGRPDALESHLEDAFGVSAVTVHETRSTRSLR